MNDPTPTIEELVPLLAQEAIAAFEQQSFASPVVRLKLYYYDTCAPSCYFLGHALTAADRTAIMESDGPNALETLWRRDRGAEVMLGTSEGTRTSALLTSLYEMMSEEEDASLSRQLATRLCVYLNSLAWPSSLTISDDFVAYPTNGTDHGCDVYDDICNAIPAGTLVLLRDRGFLGEGERNWDTRPNFPTAADFIEGMQVRIDSLAKEERVPAWIQILDETLAGTNPEIKMMGVKAETPLRFLKMLGRDSAMSLLVLAAKWSERIETWENGWEPTPNIPDRMCEIIDFVRKNADASDEAERLLTHVLHRCQGYQEMGLPLYCCNALYHLFDGYPVPIESDGYPDCRPTNLGAFTSSDAGSL